MAKKADEEFLEERRRLVEERIGSFVQREMELFAAETGHDIFDISFTFLITDIPHKYKFQSVKCVLW